MSQAPPPIGEPHEETPIDALPKSDSSSQYPCSNCGAKLEFKPGAVSLTCPYCQSETPIPQSEEDVVEIDFHTQLAELASQEETEEHTQVKCNECGAQVDKPEGVTSMECPYCGTAIVMTGVSAKLIKPKSLLPFHITKQQATAAFQQWIKGLWFAPNKLKQYARMDSGLRGMYVPHWTYDSDTISFYRGQRGDDYTVTKTRTNAEGKTETYTATETRWTSVSGTVYVSFDDVLVLATNSLPRKYADKLEPWDMQNLVNYSDDYLAGFGSESYQLDLAEGFGVAQEKMDGPIRTAINSDIGGDHQRISSKKTQYNNVTFKHILLPIWINAYKYADKAYRFLVNARTGEVQGERPWSWVKITLAVLGGLAIIGGIAAVIAMSQGG